MSIFTKIAKSNEIKFGIYTFQIPGKFILDNINFLKSLRVV